MSICMGTGVVRFFGYKSGPFSSGRCYLLLKLWFLKVCLVRNAAGYLVSIVGCQGSSKSLHNVERPHRWPFFRAG